MYKRETVLPNAYHEVITIIFIPIGILIIVFHFIERIDEFLPWVYHPRLFICLDIWITINEFTIDFIEVLHQIGLGFYLIWNECTITSLLYELVNLDFDILILIVVDINNDVFRAFDSFRYC